MPEPAARIKPGGPQEVVIMLPNGGQASVHLHFGYANNRIAVSRVGIVNYFPDRAEVSALRTRIYVDAGEPLAVEQSYDFDAKKNSIDFHILRDLPRGAKAEWLVPEVRPVSPRSIRGPTVVIFYSVNGQEGLAKVQYRAIWDVPG